MVVNYTYFSSDFWNPTRNPDVDPHISKWPLFRSGPWELHTILGVYLLFCLVLGPRWMRHRKPFDWLLPVIRIYNFSMIAFNLYLFSMAFYFLDFGRACWGCKAATGRISPDLTYALWLAFFSRLCDLVDTVFFVLRKKQSHVSFLHVLHHTATPLVSWYGLKFVFRPVSGYMMLVNYGIHVIMFTYYGLSTIQNPVVQKWLWWKKHLTKMQIIQFASFVVHGSQLWIYRKECSYPLIYKIQTGAAVLFLFLFASFYVNAYMKPKKQKIKTDRDVSQMTEIKKLQNGALEEVRRRHQTNLVQAINATN